MYQAWSVVFGETPTAAKWNILGTNDASFNDGSGIGAGVITPPKLGGRSVNTQYDNTGINTASTSYVNILGPITIDVVAPCYALILFQAQTTTNTANVGAAITFRATGANAIAESEANGASGLDTEVAHLQNGSSLVGLTNSGSTSFYLMGRIFGGGATGTFINRRLSVIIL